ncbi:MAG: hypothetical protein Q9M40_10425 [Sulfurimonas sp.]|nr:hypothetical protein [Sulfurimonas sp.]
MKLLQTILTALAISILFQANISADNSFTPSTNTKLAVEYTIDGNIDEDFLNFQRKH